MKDIVSFINEGSLEFPMKGVLKKGDEVTILWLDAWSWDDNKKSKIVDVETGKVEEVKTKAETAVTSIKKKLQALNDGLGDEFNIFG